MSEILINKITLHPALSIEILIRQIYNSGMVKDPQMSFEIRSHGGARKNAGRKRRLESEPAHTARPRIDERTPAHITLKLIEDTPSLRNPIFLRVFTKAVKRAQNFGLRVQHFAIESNHIHLIAETDDNASLTRGMTSLKTSISWALKKLFGFYGSIFSGRYHLRLIKTPTEMRNLLKYVLFNHAHHCKSEIFADVYSTIFEFAQVELLIEKQLRGQPPRWQTEIASCLSQARSWMQRLGWTRARHTS